MAELVEFSRVVGRKSAWITVDSGPEEGSHVVHVAQAVDFSEVKIAGTIWTGSGEFWDGVVSYRLKLVPGVRFVDIGARWGGFWIYRHNGFSITCFQSYVFCLDVETLLCFYGLILVVEINYILFFHIPNTVLRQRRGKPFQRLALNDGVMAEILKLM